MFHRRRQSSPDPVIIERRPQLTIGAKLFNLVRIRKPKVEIIEESPVRSRRSGRRARAPSPSPSPPPPPLPPPPPRGPYYTMSPHLQNEVYTPLPPKLPPKPKHHNDDPIDHIVEERSPRIRKVRVIHDDPDAHPHVERPPSRGRRNSGKHHVADPPMAAGGPARPQYQHRRPEPEVGQLIDDLERERRERREAERLAAAAEEEARRLKAEMARERRQRSLERRERDLLEVERRLMLEEQDRLRGPVRRPRDRGDVVVVQPSYPQWMHWIMPVRTIDSRILSCMIMIHDVPLVGRHVPADGALSSLMMTETETGIGAVAVDFAARKKNKNKNKKNKNKNRRGIVEMTKLQSKARTWRHGVFLEPVAR
ncbi:hypothetical protein KCU88_g404, partial [Aureobasidium melanogenum]